MTGDERKLADHSNIESRGGQNAICSKILMSTGDNNAYFWEMPSMETLQEVIPGK